MRPTTRRFAFALLLTTLAPATFPQLAYAQAAADPTLAAAHARFAEGVAYFDKGDYANARASFLQAYALHKHPAVLINLAQSSLRSGHALDAARDFARYMHDSASLSPAQRAEAEKGLAEARQKIGRIDVSAPAGTAVTIDGDLAGTDGSTTWDVEPGTHTVKAGVESTTVSVVAGQTASVRLGKGAATPVPSVTPVPPEPVTGPPPDTAPPAPPPAPPPPPPSSSTSPGLFSPPSTMLPVWLGIGASAAGFATAIIFGVFKGNAQDSYNSEVSEITEATAPHSAGACNNPTNPMVQAGCSALTNDQNAVSQDATAANVGIAVGVIGLGFAAGWYLFAPKAQSSSTAASNDPPKKPSLATFHVAPILSPGTQGFSVGGTF